MHGPLLRLNSQQRAISQFNDFYYEGSNYLWNQSPAKSYTLSDSLQGYSVISFRPFGTMKGCYHLDIKFIALSRLLQFFDSHDIGKTDFQ